MYLGISHDIARPVSIILGVLLLLTGRKLFWLFIATAGFFVGMSFAGIFFTGQQQWAIFLVAVLTGLIGALLAVFAQGVAFSLAGFYAGAYITYLLTHSAGLYEMSVFLGFIGGLIGAVLAIVFIDWAVIALSSLVGAGMIIDALNLSHMVSVILLMILVSAGFLFQTRLKKNN
jgi:MFS family permease